MIYAFVGKGSIEHLGACNNINPYKGHTEFWISSKHKKALEKLITIITHKKFYNDSINKNTYLMAKTMTWPNKFL